MGSHSIENNSQYDEEDTRKEDDRIAFRHGEIVDEYPQYQSQPYSYRESHRYTGQRYGSRQQDIGSIENDAANKSALHIFGTYLLQILYKSTACLSITS